MYFNEYFNVNEHTWVVLWFGVNWFIQIVYVNDLVQKQDITFKFKI